MLRIHRNFLRIWIQHFSSMWIRIQAFLVPCGSGSRLLTNKIIIFPLKNNLFLFFPLISLKMSFTIQPYLYIKLLIKNGKIIIFFPCNIRQFFTNFIKCYVILIPWIWIHINNGSESGFKRPNLCGSGRIRIHNTGFNTIRTGFWELRTGQEGKEVKYAH